MALHDLGVALPIRSVMVLRFAGVRLSQARLAISHIHGILRGQVLGGDHVLNLVVLRKAAGYGKGV